MRAVGQFLAGAFSALAVLLIGVVLGYQAHDVRAAEIKPSPAVSIGQAGGTAGVATARNLAVKPQATADGEAAVYFKSCSEMRKVYPDGVSSTHPSYRRALDRNHNGKACEK